MCWRVCQRTLARALLLTGEGDVFCAGADLKERREHPGKDAEFRAPLLKFWHELAQFAKPLVIAVNGHAAGGGFELSLLGDAVVAAESAQFWLPEVQWGGIPGGWGTQLLPRLVGPVRARWIILNGHRISARNAGHGTRHARRAASRSSGHRARHSERTRNAPADSSRDGERSDTSGAEYSTD